MTSKFANPPPPATKPAVCKKGPDKPPPGNMPVGMLLFEWEIHTGPPGPTFDLLERSFLYPTSAVRWASLGWPAIPNGDVSEFIITVSPPQWHVLLHYYISSVWQFDLFTFWAPISGTAPFSTGPFPLQSGQVNGQMDGIIFRV